MTPPKLSLLFFVLLFGGCTYQRAMHEGQVYGENGMHMEALQAYQRAWSARDKAEARVAIKRSGEAHLSALISDARQALLTGELDRALDISEEAESFLTSMGSLNLTGSTMLVSLRAEIRNADIDQRYHRAEALVRDGAFEDAETELLALLRKYPDHEEAEYLLVMTQVYPAYHAGEIAMEKGLYRQAYEYFTEVTSKDAAFRDALELRDQCLEKASFRLAYVPIHASGVESDFESKLAAAVKQGILESDDPFLRLLDRENIDKLLDEQMQGMSSLFDEEKAAQAGMLEGAEFVLAVEVIRYKNQLGKMQQAERKGYLGTSPRAASKVRYMEYYRKRSVEASLRYQIIHAETGQVFKSELIPYSHQDVVNYAIFEGPSEELYPGEWQYKIIGSRYDMIDEDGFEDLQDKLKARRKLASSSDMENDLLRDVSQRIAEALSGFEPGP